MLKFNIKYYGTIIWYLVNDIKKGIFFDWICVTLLIKFERVKMFFNEVKILVAALLLETVLLLNARLILKGKNFTWNRSFRFYKTMGISLIEQLIFLGKSLFLIYKKKINRINQLMDIEWNNTVFNVTKRNTKQRKRIYFYLVFLIALFTSVLSNNALLFRRVRTDY